MSDMSRREFIKQGSALSATLALSQAIPVWGQGSRGPLKVAMVGVGRRGSNLLKILLELKHVQIVALGDLRQDLVERAQSWVTVTGQDEPAGFYMGEWDFKRRTWIW